MLGPHRTGKSIVSSSHRGDNCHRHKGARQAPALLSMAWGPCLLLGRLGTRWLCSLQGAPWLWWCLYPPHRTAMLGREAVQGRVRLQTSGGWRVNLRISFSALEFVLNLIHTEIKRCLVG